MDADTMHMGVEDRKRDLIEQVLARVRDRLPPDRAALVGPFVSEFYAHVPAEDLATANPDDMYGAALSLYGFAEVRAPQSCKVRVYNPDPERDGWSSSHTIVETVNDDMPFLVDSVSAELHRYHSDVHLVIHPILDVERDASGRIVQLAEGVRGGVSTESVMHVQISEQPASSHEEIRANVEGVLNDVRMAVGDWPEMRARCHAAIQELKENPPALPREEIDEAIAFLEWADDDNFIYLGYRQFAFEGEGAETRVNIDFSTGLGILRNPDTAVFGGIREPGRVPPQLWEKIRKPEALRITKGNRRSRVHRPVYMDTISVKHIDGDMVDRERLFVGLFTSEAYSRNPRDIPLLRKKIRGVLERAGFRPGSHNANVLNHIVETYPRDELFQITEEGLYEKAMGILNLQERQRTSLFVRKDPFERFVSCLVYVPRDRYDTALRKRFEKILCDAFQGTVRDYYTLLNDTTLARLRFIIQVQPGHIPDVNTGSLTARLRDASRTWGERLSEALVAARGEEAGIRVFRRFEHAFPPEYPEHAQDGTPVEDIGLLEEAIETGRAQLNLYRPPDADPHELRLKVYSTGLKTGSLSEVVPLLEHLGLLVKTERPYRIRPEGVEVPVRIRDFDLETRDGTTIHLDEVKEVFEDAIEAVWTGAAEDDGFNELVLRAGMTARQVAILRSYARFLRQARIPFSQEYMEQTLAHNVAIARGIVELFETRFDPRNGLDLEGRERAADVIATRIRDELEEVKNLDEDRIIRRVLNAVEVTLRTNYYQLGANGLPKPYTSIKLNSAEVTDLPLPRPFREIFVYAPNVEGIHLRGGMVARGGLRWSDRREDFRTEILGLMKAQMVKNAVIVPVGSKGGFVVKQDRHAEGLDPRQAGVECYRTFIRGLLDVTDNLVKGRVVPPGDVVRYDGDDPYLVVAADKGTATFSDIANEIASEYGFWLDDAFASGGSAGYDHKKLGVTARGAWECVKRHFREMNKDIQTEDFTVVGVGDMSGDVFGNGMLLSPHIHLIGAFNHLHIFVDPEPDPVKSFAERKRLFEMEQSTWADYDASAISEGGGVFDRSAKSVRISPQMMARLGIEDEVLTPNDLIKAILGADVELLWFGGIGTFVKASAESHADVGDRNNDAIRIDAYEVRAQVVGEGANLAMTQRARIRHGMLGGRLNTDAIDNSAGVDCSDHEVNIKILLGAAERDGEIDRARRDDLLRSMNDDVGALAIRDNYLQTQCITVSHRMGAHLLDRFAHFMRALEKEGRLDREIEALPDDEELAERMQRGEGLTRPELATLLSYAKIELNDHLLASDLPADPYMERDLHKYFPQLLRDRFPKYVDGHQLRREIISTGLTNQVVNRVGMTFIHEVQEKTGAPVDDIVRAFVVTREVFGIRDVWLAVEGLDNRAPSALQATMLAECGRLVERSTVWLLREADRPLGVQDLIDQFADGVGAYTANLEAALAPGDLATLSQRMESYVQDGAPGALAAEVSKLIFLAPGLDVVRLAREAAIPVERVAKLYFAVGSRFGIDWLRLAAGRLPSDTAWDKRAVSAIVDDLFSHQSALTREVIRHLDEGLASAAVIDGWAADRKHLVLRTEQLIAEIQAIGSPTFAMLAVANRQLKAMYS